MINVGDLHSYCEKLFMKIASASSETEPQSYRKRGISNEENFDQIDLREALVKALKIIWYHRNQVLNLFIIVQAYECSLNIVDETKNGIWNFVIEKTVKTLKKNNDANLY